MYSGLYFVLRIIYSFLSMKNIKYSESFGLQVKMHCRECSGIRWLLRTEKDLLLVES
jgi:hypothetical protein